MGCTPQIVLIQRIVAVTEVPFQPQSCYATTGCECELGWVGGFEHVGHLTCPMCLSFFYLAECN